MNKVSPGTLAQIRDRASLKMRERDGASKGSPHGPKPGKPAGGWDLTRILFRDSAELGNSSAAALVINLMTRIQEKREKQAAPAHPLRHARRMYYMKKDGALPR